jgi:uncharacterized protein YrzB (UPF0473 family)
MTNQPHVENDHILRIPNENGEEELFEILFTFEHDDTGKKYMFVTPVEPPEDDDEYQEVLAFRYTGEGDDIQLEMIEEDNEEEWDMVEEVFETMIAGWDEVEEEDGENEDGELRG